MSSGKPVTRRILNEDVVSHPKEVQELRLLMFVYEAYSDGEGTEFKIKRRNVTYYVILRRVHVTTLAVEKQ